MNYIKDQTQYTLAQIRRDNPNISIPNGEPDLTHLGYAKIEEVTPPTPGEGQIVRQGDPEEYAPGQWRQTWIVEDAPPPSIPSQVERLQARLALIAAGLWDAVVAYFADPSRTAEELAFWEDARVWRRDDPIIAAAGAALGLTTEQVDALFVDASQR